MIPYSFVSLDTVSSTGAILDVLQLTDTVNYHLENYPVQIPPRNASTLASESPWANVEDVITIHVTGGTVDSCVQAWRVLVDRLDQAARWWDGDAVNPVQIRIQIQGSTQGDLVAMVHGAAPGANLLEVNPEFDEVLDKWIIRDVAIPFIRRPQWLVPVASIDAPSDITTTGNPAVVTFSGLTNTNAAVPAAVQWSYNGVGAVSFGGSSAYIFVSSGGDTLNLPLRIVDASTLTATGYTAVADAANLPFNGTNVLRYTPTGTAYAASGAVAVNQPDPAYQQFAVVAVLRNNSASVGWWVRPEFVIGAGTINVVSAGVPTIVDAGSTQPQIVPLGIVTLETNPSLGCSFRLSIAAQTTSGSPTLDISHVVLLAMDDPCAAIVRLPAPSNRIISLINGDMGPYRASIASNTAITEGITAGLGWDGNVNATQIGTRLMTTLIETSGARWTIPDGVAKANLTARLRRRRAFLVPQ